jgi:flagellin
MALTILNNIAAIAAENQLNVTSNNLDSTLEQLSSGSRINSGADDPAGLAIANGLEANIAALTQSASNATDGVGELQVADGALSQVTTLLNRAVTLATESATGTVPDSQRVALDDEYTSIKAEINSIGSTTNYNGGQVFTANTLNVFLSDGSATGNSTIGVTTGLLSPTSLSLGGATSATATLTNTAAVPAASATATLTGGTFVGSAPATTTLTAGGTVTAADTVLIGGTTYTFVASLTGAANQVLIGTGNTSALLNLQSAVNGTAGAGTTYGTGTVANGSVVASGASASTLTFTAKLPGTAGNAITSTTGTPANEAFTAGTLAGGTTGDTVDVAGQTYTFVTALVAGGAANQVLVGNEATSLANLAAAVNLTSGGAGVTYGTGTTANASASATATTTTATFTAITAGTAGNVLVSTLTGGVGSFAAGTFAGGAAAIGAGVAAAGNTVTVGTQTYTFVAALNPTPTANEVLVGTTEAASLTNLANAVNGGSGSGATYGSPTVANTSATAIATATTVAFTAINNGTTGNAIVSTETGSGNTFAAGTFAGGAAGSVNDLLSQPDAQSALQTINAAVATVAALRGAIGATVNRLQSASDVITNQVQNLTAAENDVTAADIPTAVANLTQYSILEQTGISALAQANQQQQLVLKLLQ